MIRIDDRGISVVFKYLMFDFFFFSMYFKCGFGIILIFIRVVM